jgi:hypothetical protein
VAVFRITWRVSRAVPLALFYWRFLHFLPLVFFFQQHLMHPT